MISQREADLSVLMSISARLTSGSAGALRLARITNSLTAGGYLTVDQFESAIGTLLRFQMIQVSDDRERTVNISDYGTAWLAENFHWVEGDRAILTPNDDAWVMTQPESISEGH